MPFAIAMSSRVADPNRLLAALITPVLDADAQVPAEVWPSLLEAAGRSGLLPALRVALRDRDQLAPVPPSMRTCAAAVLPEGRVVPAIVLEDAYQASQIQVRDLVEQADDVLDALAGAGVEALPLKGIDAVRTGRYDDPATRTMSDVDILVPEARRERVTQVVEAMGYGTVGGRRPNHALAPRRRAGRRGTLDLHVAMVGGPWRSLLPASVVLARAVPGSDRRGLELSRTDATLHLVAHAQLHHEGHRRWSLPLRALHETALILQRDEPVDWAFIGAAFSGIGHRSALDTHLALTEQLFAARLPWPPSRRSQARARGVLAANRNVWTAYVLAGAWSPNTLSASRMELLYGAEGRRQVWRARARHVRRSVTGTTAGSGRETDGATPVR